MSILKTVNILIADSHPMIRHGITKMLSSKSSQYYFRILEAEDRTEAVNKIRHTSIDIVILDDMLPETTGPEMTKEMILVRPGIRVLVMSESLDLVHVIKTKGVGAYGFILKNIQTSELLAAIDEILNGNHYYSAVVANKLLQQNSPDLKATFSYTRKISPREHVVLKLVVLGKTNKEIADELYIGERTVETHRKNLMHKLQVRNAAALIRVSYEQRLLP